MPGRRDEEQRDVATSRGTDVNGTDVGAMLVVHPSVECGSDEHAGCKEPFAFNLMGVHPISSAHLRVRPSGA